MATTRILIGLAAAVTTAAALAACGPATHPAAPNPAGLTSTSATVASSPVPPPTDTASAAPGPDGRITMAQLLGYPVRVPKWSATQCPSGMQRLYSESTADQGKSLVHLIAVVHTNLDGDSAEETAALVRCRVGEPSISQVIAFDRDSAGHVVTEGTVISGFLWNVTGRSGGGINVDISDSYSCCSTPKALELHETRGYAWRTGRYIQVAGPTSFVPHPKKIDLSVDLVEVTWSEPAHRLRTGTVLLLVTNNSAYPSGSMLVYDEEDQQADPAHIVPGLPANSSQNVTVTIVLPDDGYPYSASFHTVVSVNERGAGAVGGDANPKDNYVEVGYW